MKQPALRVPLEATRKVLDLSATETTLFRTCRRRWHLETIENLEPRTPAWALEFGTWIHLGIEALLAGGNVEDAIEDAVAETYEKLEPETSEDEDELHELHQLARDVMRLYVEYDATATVQLGKPVAIEGRPLPGSGLELSNPYGEDAAVEQHESGRLLVPIVNPATKKPLPGKPCLSMRLDLITERKTPKKGLWLWDHKTASRAPQDRGLDLDEQLTAYCYGVWRLTGQIPRGAGYNVLIKNAPSEPRYLKSGELSTAKDQRTTPSQYKAALIAEGLMKGAKITSPKHADCYAGLLAKGWDPFFRRYEALRNEAQLEAFEERLPNLWDDMLAARDDPEQRYPNPSTYTLCPSCPVRPICLAMEEGNDVEWVIKSQFRQAPDRKAE